MAILQAEGDDGASFFEIRPYKISERGEPDWILTKTSVTDHGNVIFTATVSLTPDDIAALTHDLRDLIHRRKSDVSFRSTDDDLLLDGYNAELPPSEWVVAVFIGERYSIARGFRILAETSAIEAFAEQLENDLLKVRPPAPLP